MELPIATARSACLNIIVHVIFARLLSATRTVGARALGDVGALVWVAEQLKLVAPDLLQTIKANSPEVLIEKILVIGPNGPNWKKGARTIRGARGPRDTYG